MHGNMIFDTPTMGSVCTSIACLNCPLSIFGRDFRMDLVCLLLDQLDMILDMNWLEYNHVFINCFDNSIIFLDSGVKNDLFFYAKQVDESLKDGVVLFTLLASLDLGEK